MSLQVKCGVCVFIFVYVLRFIAWLYLWPPQQQCKNSIHFAQWLAEWPIQWMAQNENCVRPYKIYTSNTPSTIWIYFISFHFICCLLFVIAAVVIVVVIVVFCSFYLFICWLFCFCSIFAVWLCGRLLCAYISFCCILSSPSVSLEEFSLSFPIW